MKNLTVRQKRALRYASIKAAGDREVASSTPNMERWIERRGWAAGLAIALLILAGRVAGVIE